jgi:hypothetical protein
LVESEGHYLEEALSCTLDITPCTMWKRVTPLSFSTESEAYKIIFYSLERTL